MFLKKLLITCLLVSVSITMLADQIKDNSTRGASDMKDVGNRYTINDTGPAGGKVFYVSADGLHGLEAAPDHKRINKWGCSGVTIEGADGTGMGTGAQNTKNILQQCKERGTAADFVSSYEINGYKDWFLPSVQELMASASVVGPNRMDVMHWSSTQIDPYVAVAVHLGSNRQGGAATRTYKNGIDSKWSTWVRPVRAF